MLVLLFLITAAFAQNANSDTGFSWGQVGSVIGLVVTSAMTSGAAVIGANRLKGSAPNPSVPDGFFTMIGERTAAMQADQSSIKKDMGLMRRRQHKQGNVLLILMAREAPSHEEEIALKTLQDDSEED